MKTNNLLLCIMWHYRNTKNQYNQLKCIFSHDCPDPRPKPMQYDVRKEANALKNKTSEILQRLHIYLCLRPKTEYKQPIKL